MLSSSSAASYQNSRMAVSAGAACIVDDGRLNALIAGLRECGYNVIAPTPSG